MLTVAAAAVASLLCQQIKFIVQSRSDCTIFSGIFMIFVIDSDELMYESLMTLTTWHNPERHKDFFKNVQKKQKL